jgi:hypothetical protein
MKAKKRKADFLHPFLVLMDNLLLEACDTFCISDLPTYTVHTYSPLWNTA